MSEVERLREVLVVVRLALREIQRQVREESRAAANATAVETERIVTEALDSPQEPEHLLAQFSVLREALEQVATDDWDERDWVREIARTALSVASNQDTKESA